MPYLCKYKGLICKPNSQTGGIERQGFSATVSNLIRPFVARSNCGYGHFAVRLRYMYRQHHQPFERMARPVREG